ncbi:uncharacterized protein LOC126381438 [Pectinophora gossypiella]|uniref:uncharacterized protein LOC126381438 n=1 Tax=Pectinophora gossypiella TaxID=13191 RepID=UPI00214E3707|nr:uncharacterized protein LOC126381438 [Pectinophora gossypiella]
MLGLTSDTYTFVSEAHGSRRWLDHCVITEAEAASLSFKSVKGSSNKSRPIAGWNKHVRDAHRDARQKFLNWVQPVSCPPGRCDGAESVVAGVPERFTAKSVFQVIKQMKRGKSPGHDGLSIEHLLYAGPHLSRLLDLSKAFDRVQYDILWGKLRQAGVPADTINVLRYWYEHQTNQVRWLGQLSDEYRLECGVRQGGLTSPSLFNFYINQLIDELSSACVGCSLDGLCVNSISYADDMVLLSPSIAGLRKLMSVCERYAESHGLLYNVEKSELMVFVVKGRKLSNVPPVYLNKVPLARVSSFKYLGHIVNEKLKDDTDMERERRALAVRCNMLARRFARCSAEVKITLFKAFCQAMYTCNLWVDYTRGAYNALRVQYNNAFRVMLGLPRFCSASGMFAQAHTDGFQAVLRKRVFSLMHRVRASANTILKVISDKPDCPLMMHWVHAHMHVPSASGGPGKYLN